MKVVTQASYHRLQCLASVLLYSMTKQKLILKTKTTAPCANLYIYKLSALLVLCLWLVKNKAPLT